MNCPTCGKPGDFPAMRARSAAKPFDGSRDCALLANRFGIVAPCRVLPKWGFFACDLVYGCKVSIRFTVIRKGREVAGDNPSMECPPHLDNDE